MPAITRQFQVALLIGLAAGIAIGVAVTAIAAAQAPPPPAEPPAAVAQGPAVSADVRITARLLENGKVEFGLQQRTGDGWGEISLPRVNKFPYATTTVDQWRYSSPVAVAVAVAGPGGATAPQAAAGEWQRAGDRGSGYVDWNLVGMGAYNAAGRAGSDHTAHPHLSLSCVGPRGAPAGRAWSGPYVYLNAGAGYWSAESRQVLADTRGGLGFALLDSRGEGGALYGWGARYLEGVHPQVEIKHRGLAIAFLDQLRADYARSPIAHLEAQADNAPGVFDLTPQFSGRFDLTGLPAVLADLPCYDPIE